MVVQHNLTAMNSNRMLGLTTSSQAKSTEKLSSGYKINRAADDAAGLSISEKMRKQIRGLTQASANAQDGISAVQTAEGALNEVQDMLQRMNELAIKAANGTNSDSDRSYIQDEINQLVTEIDRVSETTKFNESYLLKGDSAAAKQYVYSYKPVTASEAKAASVSMGGTSPVAGRIEDKTTGLTVDIQFVTAAVSSDQNEIAKGLVSQGLNVSLYSRVGQDDKIITGYSIQLNGSLGDNYSIVQSTVSGKYEILNANNERIATFTVSGGTVATADINSPSNSISATITAAKASAAKKAGEVDAYYDKDGNKISANALGRYFATNSGGSAVARVDAPTVYDALGNIVTLTASSVENQQILTGDLKLSLQVGADATNNNQITLNLSAMSSKSLGVNGLRVDEASSALDDVETI